MAGGEHKVADVSEFEDATRVIAEVEGREIAVFNVDGAYHALANYCVHQAGPLCEGELVGSTRRDEQSWTYDEVERNVVCPWHSWEFDVTTGRNVQDERYAVPTYEVSVEDDAVFVSLSGGRG